MNNYQYADKFVPISVEKARYFCSKKKCLQKTSDRWKFSVVESTPISYKVLHQQTANFKTT